MTFKHVKFEDSLVMRSLEKLAQEKGLVKPDKVTKTASAKTDLSPTTTLMGNIMILCAGLRQSGYHKFAEELEARLVNYKQAQTLYETSPEKGEDLVDRAHPKGSHKLEDVEGGELAVFETIIDQHLKNVKMIDKKPTGKLSEARSIINSVRTVLAQSSTELASEKQKAIKDAITRVNALLQKQRTDSPASRMGQIQQLMFISRNNSPAQAAALKGSINSAKAMLQYVDPVEMKKLEEQHTNNYGAMSAGDRQRYSFSTDNYSVWEQVRTELDGMLKLADEMASLAKGDTDFLARVEAQLTRLNKTFRSLLNDPTAFTAQDKREGNAEIDKFVATLTAWKNVVAGADQADKATEAARYEGKLKELIPQIDQLYKEMTE